MDDFSVERASEGAGIAVFPVTLVDCTPEVRHASCSDRLIRG